MGWTKGDFVTAALEEIGYAAYIYDLMPEQAESVMRALDAMMADWNSQGIYCGYPMPGSINSSNLSTPTNVQDAAYRAIYKNLAIEICPRFGKTASQDLIISAKRGYNALLNNVSHPIERQFPCNVPAGAGNKPWRNANYQYLPTPHENLSDGDKANLDLD